MKYTVDGQYLTDIANAIREKTKKSGGIKIENMKKEIEDIPSGNSGPSTESGEVITSIKSVTVSGYSSVSASGYYILLGDSDMFDDIGPSLRVVSFSTNQITSSRHRIMLDSCVVGTIIIIFSANITSLNGGTILKTGNDYTIIEVTG